MNMSITDLRQVWTFWVIPVFFNDSDELFIDPVQQHPTAIWVKGAMLCWSMLDCHQLWVIAYVTEYVTKLKLGMYWWGMKCVLTKSLKLGNLPSFVASEQTALFTGPLCGKSANGGSNCLSKFIVKTTVLITLANCVSPLGLHCQGLNEWCPTTVLLTAVVRVVYAAAVCVQCTAPTKPNVPSSNLWCQVEISNLSILTDRCNFWRNGWQAYLNSGFCSTLLFWLLFWV